MSAVEIDLADYSLANKAPVISFDDLADELMSRRAFKTVVAPL
jgi:hypothetical protein